MTKEPKVVLKSSVSGADTSFTAMDVASLTKWLHNITLYEKVHSVSNKVHS